MNIFFNGEDIVFAGIFVLGLIFITFGLLWNKIIEWRKCRARKILANDIARYERQIKSLEYYQKIIDYMYSHEEILCPTLLKGIIEMLPDPNRLVHCTAAEWKDWVLKGHLVKVFVPGRGNVEFSLDFVADKDDAPTGEKGLTVQVQPTGQKIRFTLKLQNRCQMISGVNMEVNSYYWDFRFSGIQLLSDEGFALMMDFIMCSRDAGGALNPNNIGNRTWDF